ncbi:phosphonate metabolism transcriptional regulator PhnF [Rhizobium jaguaris]|uniref:Phosphonate metabolism transcriptional regulator PhnF n=1 Tax=Rhizobium jaguaris TaxID=1312183 RepID=A0A387G162_9HYPH|nr:phosphonate metabolism transcriptional regulator PhnF [Rhizobium jaguaris]AYG62094.1 phosphonate metabolism transcriptional regulator PhnF [Rhizobium jaguaris]
MAAELVRHEGQDEPLWKQIEAILLQEIKDGRFRGNGRLPSEFDLAAEFGVNRHTARQAIAALVQRGVLFKRKGGGSYVVPEMLDYAIGERTRFSTNVALQGREPAHTLLVVDERATHKKAAQALNMAEGDPAVYISLIGEADDIPISVGETYLSAARFPGFGAKYRETYSMTKALAHYGVFDYKRDVTRCIARMPSPEDVKHLRQSESSPVLFVESVDIDLEGHPIVYHETRYAGERVQFVIRRGDL